MIKINFNFTLHSPIKITDDEAAPAPDHCPTPPTKKDPKEKFLESLLLRRGKFIHDLVVNYLEMPEIDIVDIAREANVSKQSVHKWLIRVHGTTKKKRLKKVCSRKKRNPLKLIPELKELKPRRIQGPINNFYKIPVNNRKILIRKSVWLHSPSNTRFAKFQVNQPVSTDLILLIVEGDNYIFPPLHYKIKNTSISIDKLEPFKNKFEYLLKPLNEIPNVSIGSGKVRYRGVQKRKDFYYAHIIVNKEDIRLGKYKTDIEAARIYDKAVLYFCLKRLKTNGLEQEPFDEVEISKLIRGESGQRIAKSNLNRL